MTDPDSSPSGELAPARLSPLGDAAILVRFADRLTDAANRAAIGFAAALAADPPPGGLETVSSLVSVLLRYDPGVTGYETLAGELRLRLAAPGPADGPAAPPARTVDIAYGGEQGPDLDEVSAELGTDPDSFVAFHTGTPVRVLATGFAPGFIYLGLHPEKWSLPRRREVRESVPAGAVLFAAGQTAIAATPIRSGWHVIGQTGLRNFDAGRSPPVELIAGQPVQFRTAGK